MPTAAKKAPTIDRIIDTASKIILVNLMPIISKINPDIINNMGKTALRIGDIRLLLSKMSFPNKIHFIIIIPLYVFKVKLHFPIKS